MCTLRNTFSNTNPQEQFDQLRGGKRAITSNNSKNSTTWKSIISLCHAENEQRPIFLKTANVVRFRECQEVNITNILAAHMSSLCMLRSCLWKLLKRRSHCFGGTSLSNLMSSFEKIHPLLRLSVKLSISVNKSHSCLKQVYKFL